MTYLQTRIARHSVGSDTRFDDRLLIVAQFDHACVNWHVTPTEARELAAALVLHADRIEPEERQSSPS